jgi:hypothetical protein
LWVVHAPLTAEAARRALKQRVPDAERYLSDRGIEFATSREWYFQGNTFSLSRWRESSGPGTASLPVPSPPAIPGSGATENVAWLNQKHWRRFQAYEQALSTSLAAKP